MMWIVIAAIVLLFLLPRKAGGGIRQGGLVTPDTRIFGLFIGDKIYTLTGDPERPFEQSCVSRAKTKGTKATRDPNHANFWKLDRPIPVDPPEFEPPYYVFFDPAAEGGNAGG